MATEATSGIPAAVAVAASSMQQAHHHQNNNGSFLSLLLPSLGGTTMATTTSSSGAGGRGGSAPPIRAAADSAAIGTGTGRTPTNDDSCGDVRNARDGKNASGSSCLRTDSPPTSLEEPAVVVPSHRSTGGGGGGAQLQQQQQQQQRRRPDRYNSRRLRWTNEERETFVIAHETYGDDNDFEAMRKMIPTKTAKQIRGYCSFYRSQLRRGRRQQQPATTNTKKQKRTGRSRVREDGDETGNNGEVDTDPAGGANGAGKWSDEEKEAYHESYEKFGKDFERFVPFIPTRTLAQIQGHFGTYARYKLRQDQQPPNATATMTLRKKKKKRDRINAEREDRPRKAPKMATELTEDECHAMLALKQLATSSRRGGNCASPKSIVRDDRSDIPSDVAERSPCCKLGTLLTRLQSEASSIPRKKKMTSPLLMPRPDGGMNEGKWTDEEKAAFRTAYEACGCDLKGIAELIPTRSFKQINGYYRVFKRWHLIGSLVGEGENFAPEPNSLPPSLASDGGPEPLVVVCSAVGDSDQEDSVRRKWAVQQIRKRWNLSHLADFETEQEEPPTQVRVSRPPPTGTAAVPKARWKTQTGSDGMNEGRWTDSEKQMFRRAFEEFGPDIQKIASAIPTRAYKQVVGYYCVFRRFNPDGEDGCARESSTAAAAVRAGTLHESSSPSRKKPMLPASEALTCTEPTSAREECQPEREPTLPEVSSSSNEEESGTVLHELPPRKPHDQGNNEPDPLKIPASSGGASPDGNEEANEEASPKKVTSDVEPSGVEQKEGRWTIEEQNAFQNVFAEFGYDLEKFVAAIPTRTSRQINCYWVAFKRFKMQRDDRERDGEEEGRSTRQSVERTTEESQDGDADGIPNRRQRNSSVEKGNRAGDAMASRGELKRGRGKQRKSGVDEAREKSSVSSTGRSSRGTGDTMRKVDKGGRRAPLSPARNGRTPWTDKEKLVFRQVYDQHGYDLDRLAEAIPSRTPHQIRCYWGMFKFHILGGSSQPEHRTVEKKEARVNEGEQNDSNGIPKSVSRRRRSDEEDIKAGDVVGDVLATDPSTAVDAAPKRPAKRIRRPSDEMIGKVVYKDFGSFGWHWGTCEYVVYRDASKSSSSSSDKDVLFYHVEYYDGDREDLSPVEFRAAVRDAERALVEQRDNNAGRRSGPSLRRRSRRSSAASP